MPDFNNYIRYQPSVEVRQPNEEEMIDKVVASMGRMNRVAFDKHRHAVRDAHAKSHGILKGELTVYDNLPEPLRQGVFRASRIYPIMVRFSTAPGELENDSIAVPRGMAIKLLNVEGRKVLPGHEEDTTQDFLLVNAKTIPFGHVAAYLEFQESQEKHHDDPEALKRAAAAIARTANKALNLVGVDSEKLGLGGMDNNHILGETFYSMAALRHGGYIAKISSAPLSDAVRQLCGQPVDTDGKPSALRDLVVDFFRQHSAEYEMRVQLCTDLERMPIEDGSVEWPEEESPYQPVAKITLPVQEAYSPARRVYGDDVLSFNPWHCIEEHRPLGSIMRVRVKAYEESTRFRHEMNVQPRVEPRSVDEMPE